MVLVYNFVKKQTYKSVVMKEDKLLTLDILYLLPPLFIDAPKQNNYGGKKFMLTTSQSCIMHVLPKEGRENKVVKQLHLAFQVTLLGRQSKIMTI